MTGDALRQLAAQATPGPWRHVGVTAAGYRVDSVYGGEDGDVEITRWPRERDARLIALAPQLAQEHADLMEWAHQARDALKKHRDWMRVVEERTVSAAAVDALLAGFPLGNNEEAT